MPGRYAIFPPALRLDAAWVKVRLSAGLRAAG
jgi:hypothetical protein